jgi:hypothetical protein
VQVAGGVIEAAVDAQGPTIALSFDQTLPQLGFHARTRLFVTELDAAHHGIKLFI